MSTWTVYRVDGVGQWLFTDGKRAARWLTRLVGMGYDARMERA
jgi:hypothetical protein